MEKSVAPDAGIVDTIEYRIVKEEHVSTGKVALGAAGFVTPPKQLLLQLAEELPTIANTDDATLVSPTE